MGLVGAIAAILLRIWHQEKSYIAARRLRLIILMIAIQFVFDIINPMVSFLIHFLGLIMGLPSDCFSGLGRIINEQLSMNN